MNAGFSKLKMHIAGAKLALSAFWNARNRRERTWLSAAGVVIALAVFYGVLIEPAMSGRATLTTTLPLLRQQMAQMQAMSSEAASLSAGDALAPVDTSKQGIEASLARKGLRAQSVAVTDDTIRLQLSGVAYSDVLAWLSDMQKDARLTLIDAAFSTNGEVDNVDARLTLHRLQKDEQT
jgi:general secretion pathway protein M